MFSVIIPYYYLFDKYFDDCLASVLSQSCNFFECIIVYCKKEKKRLLRHALEDERIILVETHKIDQSSKRNCGIDSAHGDYIVFLDCDDCLNKSFIHYCLDLIEKYGPIDLISFGYTRDIADLNKPSFFGFYEKDESLFKPIIFSEYMKEKKEIDISFDSSCMKAFRKEIIFKNNIRFVEGLKCAEDAIFVMNYSSKIENCYFDDMFKSYYWRINRHSTMNKLDSGFLNLDLFTFELFNILKKQPMRFHDNLDEYITYLYKLRINDLAAKYYKNKITYIKFYNLIKKWFLFSKHLLDHLVVAKIDSYPTQIVYSCIHNRSMKGFKRIVLGKLKYISSLFTKGAKK